MPIKMFRSLSSLHTLERSVVDNLDRYREGNFQDILQDQKLLIVNEEKNTNFFETFIHSNKATDDYKNSIIIWQNLQISPRLAREARFWCFLTHTAGLEYARARYPLVNDDERDTTSIKTHFLVSNELRGIDRDNALSRLWISAFISSKVKDLDFEIALQVLLHQTDFREQLIGHPTIMRSQRVLNEVMCCAKKILIDNGNVKFFQRTKHRGQYKTWFHLLDIEGGKYLLDALPSKDLKFLIERLAYQSTE